MTRYAIIEGVTIPWGENFYEVVEDDDLKYRSHGKFKFRTHAESKLEKVKANSAEAVSAMIAAESGK